MSRAIRMRPRFLSLTGLSLMLVLATAVIAYRVGVAFAPPAPSVPQVSAINYATLVNHQEEVWSVAWWPDGQTLGSVGFDQRLRLWQADGRPLRFYNLPTSSAVAWTTDRGTIAFGRGRTMVFATSDGNVLAQPSEPANMDLYSPAWSPDGQILATLRADGLVRLWGVDGRLLGDLGAAVEGRSLREGTLAWSPDGTMLVVSGSQYHARVLRIDNTVVAIFDDPTPMFGARSMAWSPDGRVIAIGSAGGRIRLWTVQGSLLGSLRGHGMSVNSLAWSPDGTLLASGSDDRTARIWSANGHLLAVLTDHTDSVTGIAWAPDGRAFATSSKDYSVRLWRLEIDNSSPSSRSKTR